MSCFSDKIVAHVVSIQTLQVDQSGNSTQVKKIKNHYREHRNVCVWPTLITFLVVVVAECVSVPFLSLTLVFFSLSYNCEAVHTWRDNGAPAFMN